jgi:hypothetical protein
MSPDRTLLVVGGGPAGVERVAELQLALPTFTEAVCMAAQKICRTLGIGSFPGCGATSGLKTDP